jgi:TP901-1 family phage major tail protein
MTAQKGKDLLLKVDSDGAGSFATVAGLRARTLAFNAAAVDITDQESAGHWRELLEGAGIKTARVAGSCIFKDASSDATLRQYSSAARCAPGG